MTALPKNTDWIRASVNTDQAVKFSMKLYLMPQRPERTLKIWNASVSGGLSPSTIFSTIADFRYNSPSNALFSKAGKSDCSFSPLAVCSVFNFLTVACSAENSYCKVRSGTGTSIFSSFVRPSVLFLPAHSYFLKNVHCYLPITPYQNILPAMEVNIAKMTVVCKKEGGQYARNICPEQGVSMIGMRGQLA